MVHTVWRFCLVCDKLLEKEINFTKDEWKCNKCYARDPSKAVQERPEYASTRRIREVWRTLFNYLDEHNVGYISKDTIEDAMKNMMGGFQWEDTDGDADMDFEEFVACMSKLPSSTRVAAQQYASQLTPGFKRKLSTSDSPSDLRRSPQTTSFVVRKQEEGSAWKKLFNHFDEDKKGAIATKSLADKMIKMLGNIDFDPIGGMREINFDEFKNFMDQLPSSVRYSAVAWANSMLDAMGRRGSSSGSFHLSASDAFGPLVTPSVGPPTMSEEDRIGWRKLFDYLDADGSGQLGLQEVQVKMQSMIGDFTWEDADADGQMDFDEFVTCVTTKLAPSARYSVLSFAKQVL